MSLNAKILVNNAVPIIGAANHQLIFLFTPSTVEEAIEFISTIDFNNIDENLYPWVGLTICGINNSWRHLEDGFVSLIKNSNYEKIPSFVISTPDETSLFKLFDAFNNDNNTKKSQKLAFNILNAIGNIFTSSNISRYDDAGNSAAIDFSSHIHIDEPSLNGSDDQQTIFDMSGKVPEIKTKSALPAAMSMISPAVVRKSLATVMNNDILIRCTKELFKSDTSSFHDNDIAQSYNSILLFLSIERANKCFGELISIMPDDMLIKVLSNNDFTLNALNNKVSYNSIMTEVSRRKIGGLCVFDNASLKLYPNFIKQFLSHEDTSSLISSSGMVVLEDLISASRSLLTLDSSNNKFLNLPEKTMVSMLTNANSIITRGRLKSSIPWNIGEIANGASTIENDDPLVVMFISFFINLSLNNKSWINERGATIIHLAASVLGTKIFNVNNLMLFCPEQIALAKKSPIGFYELMTDKQSAEYTKMLLEDVVGEDGSGSSDSGSGKRFI